MKYKRNTRQTQRYDKKARVCHFDEFALFHDFHLLLISLHLSCIWFCLLLDQKKSLHEKKVLQVRLFQMKLKMFRNLLHIVHLDI
jgi:hypothetical protein